MNTDQKVINIYNDGNSIRQTSAKTGVSGTQVRRILKKHNVIIRSVKTDKYIECQIINAYQDGESSEVIAKNFNMNGTTVCRILKRNKIKIRSSIDNKRKYAINKSFFKDINSEEKAYALGFLYADGNVHNKKNSFNITLHKKDIDVLQMFTLWIYIDNHKINQYDENYVNFRVCSIEMVSDLIRHGCMPAKTFNLSLPTWLHDSDLLRHFVRGFLDGDGCITICNKTNRVRIIFTGYDEFLFKLRDVMFYNIGVRFHVTKIKDKVIDLSIGDQKSTRTFLHWLYDGAKVYMNRKKEKSDLALEILDNKATKLLKSNTILTFEKTKLTAKNILLMSEETRDRAAQYVFNEFRMCGFPYDRFSDVELERDFKELVKRTPSFIEETKQINNISQSGLKLFRHFCDHYYDVTDGNKPSLKEAFDDDDHLMKAIKNRMGFFFEDEAFNITGKMIRQGLRNGRISFAASVFRPSIAKFFYQKFNAERVLDISAGFGQRMIAAMACKNVRRYVATDPWIDTINALTKMKDFILPLVDDKISVELINSGSENIDSKEKFDFCFSSPPFFNKEIYSKDSSQAYFAGYDQFLEWWNKTVINVHNALQDDSYFVLNMDSKIAEDMFKNMSLFKLEDVYYINFQRSHLGKNSKDNYYVLKKQ